VCELAVGWRRDAPDLLRRELAGTLVFADISGFTKLTERLAAKGKIGAEEMSDHLDRVLSELLDASYGYGGWLVKWGGDALLLMFEGNGHVERACVASAAMRSTLRTAGLLDTSTGRVRLQMSIGVHTGTFTFHFLGSRHRELLITGDAATVTAQLEAAAAAGEILLSPQTAALLPESSRGAAKGDGILLARAPHLAQAGDRAGGAFSDSGAGPAEDVDGLIPELVYSHLVDGGGTEEHRHVTVAFLEFSGLAKLRHKGGDADTDQALQHLVDVAQEACHRYQVSFHETDISPDGGKFMLVAGAPHGLEEPAEAMLCALRQIVDDPGALSVRAGVTAGRAFTGAVGPSRRRSYSVKGDVVNLAARIMGKTPPGQIWALPVVVETSRTHFQLTDVPRFTVKGKKAPILVHSVGRALARVEGNADLPLIGRALELAVLIVSLDDARVGRGSQIDVVGATGIGKTRLLVELIEQAEDMTVLTAAAEPYRTSSPYAVVRSLFLDGLVQGAKSAAGQAKRLVAWCDEFAPELLPWLPLLNPLLGVTLEETPETRDLATEFRAERTRATILDLLRIRLPGPSLIVVDNLQFADEASVELLRLITQNVATLPWLVVMSRRIEASEAQDLGADAGQLVIGALNADASLVLVHADTDDTPLAPHVAEAVVARGDGNPLFLRQLARAAQTVSDTAELPDSIEMVVAARIDRLRPTAREVLRAAAVIGMKVERDLLDELLAEESINLTAVLDELDDFVGPAGDELRFRQVVIRDAAYEGLAFRRRAALHGRLADLLVQRYRGEREDMDAVLSLHYFHAGHYRQALEAARVAGDRAAAAYTNTEAAMLYGRAIESASRAPDVASSVRGDLLESLGDVQVRLGEYEPGERSYRAAGRILREDNAALARIGLKSARSASQRGAYTLTLNRLRRVATVVDQLPDPTAGDLRLEVQMRSAFTQTRQGRLAAARTNCLDILATVDETKHPAVAADALCILDIVELELGMPVGDERAERALRLHSQLSDLGGQARTHCMVGYRAYRDGRWNDAVAEYEQAQRLYRRLGDLPNAAVNDANVAEILLDQGRYEQAETELRQAVRIWRASGADNVIAFGLILLGRSLARQGRYDEADVLLEQGRAQCVDQGAKADLVEADSYRAESLALQGRAAEGLALAEETLAAAGRLSGQPSQAPLLYRIIGACQDALGRPDEGDRSYAQALDLARQREADHEVAFAIAAMIARGPSTGRAVDPALVDEVGVLRQRLGLVIDARTLAEASKRTIPVQRAVVDITPELAHD
jgi:class 3 adenylate cyclase/tetratricopeptide (TPR) repeat protein